MFFLSCQGLRDIFASPMSVPVLVLRRFALRRSYEADEGAFYPRIRLSLSVHSLLL